MEKQLYCHVCNSIVDVKIVDVIKRYQDQYFDIEYEGKECLCSNCGEALFSDYVVKYNQNKIKEKIIEILKKYFVFFNVSSDRILKLKNNEIVPKCRSFKMEGDDGRIIHIYTCPNCGFESLDRVYNYCPGCGRLISKEHKMYD